MLQKQASLLVSHLIQYQRSFIHRCSSLSQLLTIKHSEDDRHTDRLTSVLFPVATHRVAVSASAPKSAPHQDDKNSHTQCSYIRDEGGDIRDEGGVIRDEGGVIRDEGGVISHRAITLSLSDQMKYQFACKDDLHTLNHSTLYKGQEVLEGNDSKLHKASANQESGDKPSANQQPHNNMPSQETLDKVKNQITEVMPDIFKSTPHPYSMYTADVVLENNYSGTNQVSRGAQAYAVELAKMRMKVNFAYCNVVLYIIHIDTNMQNGTVRMRWCLKGIPQIEGFKFWKWNLWNLRGKGGVREKMTRTFVVHDGFNTFHVNQEGQIYKLRIDKVTPDEELKPTNPTLDKISKIIVKQKLAGTATSSSSSRSDKSA